MRTSRFIAVLCLVLPMLALVIAGCIGNTPANPAATQPVTVVDPATTQPSYWLNQAPAAQLQTQDFDAAWAACKRVARDYLFEIDREDFRAGLITTNPMVSKQVLEVWRPDTGTIGEAVANTLSTIRRTLRFEITRGPDNSYTITPKVLIERETVLERRVTSVVQYRTAFSGPRSDPKYAVQSETDPENLQVKYWYPIGRDLKMEKNVAKRLNGRIQAVALQQPAGAAPGGSTKVLPIPGMLVSDGNVVNIGASQTIYINLGSADHIVPGMSFEVFGSRATIPPLEHYAAQNEGSKGWIEVISVANSSSTCRVIKKTGNAAVEVGDQIFNFIYDRKIQNHFALAGDFANPDRETLTGMIWRWNGVVDDQLGAGTTYLIFGQAPKDDAAKQAYRAAREKAAELKIPILDEEKFNLLVRYYDPGTR